MPHLPRRADRRSPLGALVGSLVCLGAVLGPIEGLADDLASVQGNEQLVGTWELVEVRNVRGKDIPRGGFRNLLVEITQRTDEGGIARWWLPQDDEVASAPYAFAEGRLTGRIGLSSDLDAPRSVRWPHDGWMEIGVPDFDGLVGLFRRVDDPAQVVQRCVPMTVAGEPRDPEVVAETREALFTFEAGQAPDGLVGRWRASDVVIEGEGRFEIELHVEADRARLGRRALDDPDADLALRETPLEVSGGFLRMQAFDCGRLQKFELDGLFLDLWLGGMFEIRFERFDEEVGGAGPRR